MEFSIWFWVILIAILVLLALIGYLSESMKKSKNVDKKDKSSGDKNVNMAVPNNVPEVKTDDWTAMPEVSAGPVNTGEVKLESAEAVNINADSLNGDSKVNEVSVAEPVLNNDAVLETETMANMNELPKVEPTMNVGAVSPVEPITNVAELPKVESVNEVSLVNSASNIGEGPAVSAEPETLDVQPVVPETPVVNNTASEASANNNIWNS